MIIKDSIRKMYWNCGGKNILSMSDSVCFILNTKTNSKLYTSYREDGFSFILKGDNIAWNQIRNQPISLAQQLINFINEELLLYKLELVGDK